MEEVFSELRRCTSSLKWRPNSKTEQMPRMDRGEGTFVKEKTGNATKFLQAIAKIRESGLVITDKTRKGGGMGLVGGVSRTARNNEMLHSDILPEHSCDGELIQWDRSHAYLKQARCSTCGTEFTYVPDSDWVTVRFHYQSEMVDRAFDRWEEPKALAGVPARHRTLDATEPATLIA
jgi:hypothetical protein